MKIYAPVSNASGVWATVRFVNGVGETDDPRLLKWFEEHGYTLDDSTGAVAKRASGDGKPKESLSQRAGVNLDVMTDEDIRKWMVSKGYGKYIRGTKNREKLLAKLEEILEEQDG